MGTGGRPDFGLRPDFGFRPKLGPQKADLSNFDTKMHSATRRVFWDASRRRRSPPEVETAEIRNPAEIRARPGARYSDTWITGEVPKRMAGLDRLRKRANRGF